MRANAVHSSLTAVAAILVLSSPSQAQSGSSSGFKLELDPVTIAYESVDVDTESAKFNEYRDLKDGFLLERLNLRGSYAGGDRNFSVTARRAGRDDAFYAFDYRSEGSYSFKIELNRIPHRFGNNGLLLFDRTGPGRYEIDDATQASLQLAIADQFRTNRAGVNYNFLNGLLQPYLATAGTVDLALRRDRARAELELGKAGRFAWGLTLDHEDRSGTRPYGASLGFSNVAELPEPIDYRTTSGQLNGEWKGERGGVQFGGRLSRFENKIDVLVWDNVFRLTSTTDPNAYTAPGSSSIGGTAFGRAPLVPDNEAMTLFVNGRGKFGLWTMQGSLSYVTMEQDDALQSYTLNSAIRGIDEQGATFDATDRSFLPQSSADREVDVFSFSGSAGVPLGKSFKLDFRARYYDYDNGSDRVVFPGYVRFDAVWEEIGRITVPYAYDRTDLSADLGWNIARGTRLGLVAGLREMNRSFREIENAEEIFVRLDGSTRKGGFWLHGHLELGDRSTDSYHVEAQHDSFTHPEAVNNLPDLRKFDEAERDYLDYLLQADWALSETLDLTFGVSGRDEDYSKSLFGLHDDEILRFNAELNWRVGESGNVYLFANRADREVFQLSRQSGATVSTDPLNNWQVRFDELNEVVGLGLNLELAERWQLDVSGRWSRSDGAADIFSPPGGTPNLGVGFDDYEDIELLASVVDLGFEINDRMAVGFGWRYEDYVAESFITRGLTYYLPGTLLLNAENGDYQGDVLTVRFSLKH